MGDGTGLPTSAIALRKAGFDIDFTGGIASRPLCRIHRGGTRAPQIEQMTHTERDRRE